MIGLEGADEARRTRIAEGIAFHTRSIDSDIAEAAQNGFACVQRGDRLDTPQNGTYAYLDTKDALKCTIELLDFVKRQTK